MASSYTTIGGDYKWLELWAKLNMTSLDNQKDENYQHTNPIIHFEDQKQNLDMGYQNSSKHIHRKGVS